MQKVQISIKLTIKKNGTDTKIDNVDVQLGMYTGLADIMIAGINSYQTPSYVSLDNFTITAE